jgi:hypothetical protein
MYEMPSGWKERPIRRNGFPLNEQPSQTPVQTPIISSTPLISPQKRLHDDTSDSLLESPLKKRRGEDDENQDDTEREDIDMIEHGIDTDSEANGGIVSVGPGVDYLNKIVGGSSSI